MDRIVSSKLVFYVVGRSRVSRRRNLRNFSKIFGHEFATGIESRRSERELLSPLFRILLQTRAKTFPSVNESTEVASFSRESRRNRPVEKEYDSVAYVGFFFSTEEESRRFIQRNWNGRRHAKTRLVKETISLEFRARSENSRDIVLNAGIGFTMICIKMLIKLSCGIEKYSVLFRWISFQFTVNGIREWNVIRRNCSMGILELCVNK